MYFSAVTGHDGIDMLNSMFYSLGSSPSAARNIATVAGILVTFVISLVMSILVGRILASGLTVDNVLKNTLSIYVVLQVDDAIRDMSPTPLANADDLCCKGTGENSKVITGETSKGLGFQGDVEPLEDDDVEPYVPRASAFDEEPCDPLSQDESTEDNAAWFLSEEKLKKTYGVG